MKAEEPLVAAVAPAGQEAARENNGQALLELQSVDLSYRMPHHARLNVLQSVSLSVPKGEIVCVAGRSGSGKTTLLMTAARLLRVDGGKVVWRGEDVTRLNERQATHRRRDLIGYVFQSAGLVDLLTAQENVALPGLDGRGGEPRARAAKLLGEMGLGDRLSHFPAQLSGGERQRVAIARALFHDPPLLIIDEPTASLDKAGAEQIIELLGSLRRQGHGIVVASHDEHVIAASDRVLRLD